MEIIAIENLSFTYPDGRPALRGVTLNVRQGEKVALVGPNGAGKSTLLLHLNGILKGKGCIRVCGLDVEDGNLARIRAQVGLVFQSPDDQLFSPTVYEDVAFGPVYQGLSGPEIDDRVASALAGVGMQDYAQRTSHHLSAGEKKQIAIATVLSMQPEILVLDEPTSGLDPRARRGLIQLLRTLPQTMLVATHDLHMVMELIPRTVILDRGQIAADGPTETLLADEALLAAHGLEKPCVG